MLSNSFIKELHAALLRSQTHTDAVDPSGREIEVPLIRGDWKVQPNSPLRDNALFTYCPPEQVGSEMGRLMEMHQAHRQLGVSADLQAAWLHHRFTQIHPFQDGNGRVARAIASLVLVQAGLFPLVVTRDDKVDYLDALESADNGNLSGLVGIIARLQRTQFRRATALSENVLAAQADVQEVLSGLLSAAKQHEQQRTQSFRKVFATASTLELNVYNRLSEIAPSVTNALQRVTPSANAFVMRSDEYNSHYFRSQIIENAKHHLSYFADTNDYRSWVSLNMVWQRRAKIVFAFHGIGRPFSGSLVCAPFFDFRDADDEGQTRALLVPIAEEAFVFFYNETEQNAVARFNSWRESVLTIALKELSQNL